MDTVRHPEVQFERGIQCHDIVSFEVSRMLWSSYDLLLDHVEILLWL